MQSEWGKHFRVKSRQRRKDDGIDKMTKQLSVEIKTVTTHFVHSSHGIISVWSQRDTAEEEATEKFLSFVFPLVQSPLYRTIDGNGVVVWTKQINFNILYRLEWLFFCCHCAVIAFIIAITQSSPKLFMLSPVVVSLCRINVYICSAAITVIFSMLVIILMLRKNFIPFRLMRRQFMAH